MGRAEYPCCCWIGLYAEDQYNAAVALGQDGSEWLRTMVEAHLRRYPNGVDSKHPRNDKAPLG